MTLNDYWHRARRLLWLAFVAGAPLSAVFGLIVDLAQNTPLSKSYTNGVLVAVEPRPSSLAYNLGILGALYLAALICLIVAALVLAAIAQRPGTSARLIARDVGMSLALTGFIAFFLGAISLASWQAVGVVMLGGAPLGFEQILPGRSLNLESEKSA